MWLRDAEAIGLGLWSKTRTELRPYVDFCGWFGEPRYQKSLGKLEGAEPKTARVGWVEGQPRETRFKSAWRFAPGLEGTKAKTIVL